MVKNTQESDPVFSSTLSEVSRMFIEEEEEVDASALIVKKETKNREDQRDKDMFLTNFWIGSD